MTEADKKYYENQERQDKKQAFSLSKAMNRGQAAVEWHKKNTLTKGTMPMFKAAMKQVDKDWEKINKPLNPSYE